MVLKNIGVESFGCIGVSDIVVTGLFLICRRLVDYKENTLIYLFVII